MSTRNKNKGSNAVYGQDADGSYLSEAGNNLGAAAKATKDTFVSIADKQSAVSKNKNASDSQKTASLAVGALEGGMAAFSAVSGMPGQVSEAVIMPIVAKLAAFKGVATLPVCKQTDPVVGIDVHMIMVPPAPAPVPIPHPYVGISFRSKDFLACALATVLPTPDVAPEVTEESDAAEIEASNTQRGKAVLHQVASMAISMIGATVKFGGVLPRTVAGTPTKNIIPHFSDRPHVP
jgi:hypothetical protein